MKLLHVDSSAKGAASASRQLSAQVVREWVQAHPGTTVESLDLVADAPSHLDEHSLGIKFAPGAEGVTERQRQENALSEKLVSQFLAADVVVVGAPMYNFAIPSQLKAWIDRLAQAGRTFRYTAAGPEGLAAGKTLVVVSSRGGAYAGTPYEAAMDHQESYLRTVFGFFGITDVRIVRAEGLDMGEDSRAQGLEAAGRDIRALLDAAANEAQKLVA
ncbi:NAD(P)H-dependent oxidoreductase [Ramlibacter tataouinensis]|uniref:FMN-dependent NADH-azoreductase n=1 Tax=Ramlibacter tataouinensis TaxID=94132 RepID=UPI0022F3BF1E|nr:NAD(P)H-dependent oxidoreductase [Ramlibacter tataouinensis]WBY01882.1 NAD(P)H-dependent oxidoreductase [Ramlibacter tataouinensis]